MNKLIAPLGLAFATIFWVFGCNSSPTGNSGSKLAYRHATIIAATGVPVTPDTLVSSVTGLIGYTVSPLLPAGIEMDPNTGLISGTPLVAAAAANYVVIALTSGGVDSTTVNVTVRDSSSAGNPDSSSNAVFSYKHATLVVTKGAVMVPDTVVTTLTGIQGYTVSPALPAGISLNANTGLIFGIPTAITSASSYTVKIFASSAVDSTQVNLTVKDSVVPFDTSSSGSLQSSFSILNSPTGNSGILALREIAYNCDSTTAIADTFIDTSYYALSGGKLYIWPDTTECYAEQLSGTSSTVYGTWTVAVGAETVLIPSPYQPQGCSGGQYPNGEDYTGFFQNATVTYTLNSSSKTLQKNLVGDICFANMYAAYYYTDSLNSDVPADPVVASGNGIGVLRQSCSQVELLDSASGQTATISSKANNSDLTVQFQSGDSTCTASEDLYASNLFVGSAPDCSLLSQEDEESQPYFTCMYESGFEGSNDGDYGLAKKGAVRNNSGKSFLKLWQSQAFPSSPKGFK